MAEIKRETIEALLEATKKRYEKMGFQFAKNVNQKELRSFADWWRNLVSKEINTVTNQLGIKYVGPDGDVSYEEIHKLYYEVEDQLKDAFLNGFWNALHLASIGED